METVLKHSRSKSQVRCVRSAMKGSSLKAQQIRSSSATLDSDWSGTSKTSSQQTTSRKPPRSKTNGKRIARKHHGGVIENRWSQPDLTTSPIKRPLRRYISTQDLLSSESESTAPSMATRKSPKHLSALRNHAAPYHLKKAAMQGSEAVSPDHRQTRRTTASQESRNVARPSRHVRRHPSVITCNEVLQEEDLDAVYANQAPTESSFESTEISRLHLRIEELEKSNKKLTEQNFTIEKQLKQASELVRILLGKAKEAEKKSKKVSDLEMEIIVLRRQLAQSSSYTRITSVSSTISDDLGWRSENDSVFDQSEARKSPIGISDSNSQESIDFGIKENISFPSTCYSRTSTLLRPRERAPAERVDMNANYSAAHPCDDAIKFNTLLNEHKTALNLIQNLETKFCAQQKVIRSLKRDISSMKHKSHSQSLEDVQDQLSLLIQSLQKENMSTQDIGQYLIETFHKDQTIGEDSAKRQVSHSARRSLSLS